MSKVEPYIGPDGEVRELDDHFFRTAKKGRPKLPSAQRKERMNLMLDPDVAKALRQEENMSATVNAALRKALGL